MSIKLGYTYLKGAKTGAMTLSLTTLSIMTLSIMGLFVTLTINDPQHKRPSAYMTLGINDAHHKCHST
jgi:hypothetical protein